MPPTAATTDTTRTRLLDATGVALARYGPRKLSLTDIAALAGVSRPTLYRHFSSKEELLVALSEHEKDRFNTNLSVALHGLKGAARLDRALRFMVEFQQDYPMRGLVIIEPAFMLEQFEASLRTMSAALVPLFEQAGTRATRGASPADLADLVVRTALSHFLIEGADGEQLYRELHHVAGLDG